MDTNLTIKMSPESLSSAPLKIKSRKYKELFLDCSENHFLTPYDIVRLKCILDLAKEFSLKIKVSFSEKIKNYIATVGLTEEISVSNQENSQQTYHDSYFLPLMNIVDDRNEKINDECNRVFSSVGIATNYIGTLSDIFTELADNIYFHSGTGDNDGWGYIQAQLYKHQKAILIGICDVGVGVYGSYERRGQIKNRTEKKIVDSIFQELESSMNHTKPYMRGLGLNEAKKFIQNNGGFLRLCTGNIKLTINTEGITSEKTEYKTEGTWINMKILVDQ